MIQLELMANQKVNSNFMQNNRTKRKPEIYLTSSFWVFMNFERQQQHKPCIDKATGLHINESTNCVPLSRLDPGTSGHQVT